MKINHLVKIDDEYFRILAIDNEQVLVINCNGRGSPIYVTPAKVSHLPTESETDMMMHYGIKFADTMTAQESKECNQKYTLISPILPVITNLQKRIRIIGEVANKAHVSRRTIKRYLNQYLAYQDKRILLSKVSLSRSSNYEVNFRWALNKFYYTMHGKSLAETYTMLLKEKYCDITGTLLANRPTLHQFRYYFRKNRKLQSEYISRTGLKDYQMNHRPLLGENVQQFAPSVGTAMLDSTICDIYLSDSSGNVVGRPVLTAAIDAYSSICLGYSLTWEGGMYSIRNLFTNVLTDKVKWCKRYGILINKYDWNCNKMPAILVTDKGSEYTSMNLEQLTEFGVSITNLPAFRPELKGPVEKFFSLIQGCFKSSLKGRGVIESDFQQRGGHDYRKDACLSLQEFEKIVIHAILYYNTQRIIRNFPYTPEMLAQQIKPYANAIWNYGCHQPGANLIDISMDRLVATLLPRAIGTFTRRGLVINGLRYHCEGIVDDYLAGGNTLVAYNPDDVSAVYLVNRNYQQFNLVDSRFNSKSLVEVSTMKRMQRDLIKLHEEQNLQGKIDLIKHVETIASTNKPMTNVNLKDIRNTRMIERALTRKDFMKEVGNG